MESSFGFSAVGNTSPSFINYIEIDHSLRVLRLSFPRSQCGHAFAVERLRTPEYLAALSQPLRRTAAFQRCQPVDHLPVEQLPGSIRVCGADTGMRPGFGRILGRGQWVVCYVLKQGKGGAFCAFGCLPLVAGVQVGCGAPFGGSPWTTG